MSRLDTLISVAETIARGADAVNKLRKGKDGAAAATLATAIEKELRRVAAIAARRRRRARSQGRTASGTFRRL